MRGAQGTSVYHINNYDDLLTIPDLKEKMWILEEKIRQHPAISAVNPSSVNTIRITTVRTGASIDILHQWMKFSSNDSFIDNSHAGGLTVAVKEDGSLYDTAIQLTTKRKFTHHPVTGTDFSAVKVPYFDLVKNLVIRAHRCMYSMNSVGWDVAIGPYGPLIVEGNAHWGMDAAIFSLPPEQGLDLYRRYERLYGSQ